MGQQRLSLAPAGDGVGEWKGGLAVACRVLERRAREDGVGVVEVVEVVGVAGCYVG